MWLGFKSVKLKRNSGIGAMDIQVHHPKMATKHYSNLFDHNQRRHVVLQDQNELKVDGDQKLAKVAQ